MMILKQSLWIYFRNTIEITKQPSSRFFNLFVTFVILVSVIGHCLETLPNLTEIQIQTLNIIEWSCVIFFSAEYVLRIIVAQKKMSFIFSFYGIVDLLAVLPSFLFLSNAFGSLRVIRVFNLLRIFRLLRFISALHQLKRSLIAVRDELILFFALALILLYFSSAGIYFFEHEAQPEKFSSIIHSFWWSVVTMTTVGYGDFVPITMGGKIFSSLMILIGVAFVAVPIGILSASLTQIKVKKKY